MIDSLQVVWKRTTEERYDEMLGMLPPALMTGYGFLVGEPHDHRTCRISRRIAPTFAAFMREGEDFYEADEPLTIAEFRAAGMDRTLRAAGMDRTG